MTNKLSYRIRHNGLSSLDAHTLQLWAGEVQTLEDQLIGTAARARDFEVQASTLTGDLNTMHDELEHSRQLNKALRDDFDRMKREREEARVQTHRFEARASDLQRERDTLAEQVISWQNSSLRNADDRDYNASVITQRNNEILRLQRELGESRKEAEKLRAALRIANQSNTKLCAGGAGYMGKPTSGVGCASGISASTAPSLQELARQVLQESLNNGRWIEYPELRNFVINRFKD